MAKEYGQTVFNLIVKNRHDIIHNVPENVLDKIKIKQRCLTWILT